MFSLIIIRYYSKKNKKIIITLLKNSIFSKSVLYFKQTLATSACQCSGQNRGQTLFCPPGIHLGIHIIEHIQGGKNDYSTFYEIKSNLTLSQIVLPVCLYYFYYIIV